MSFFIAPCERPLSFRSRAGAILPKVRGHCNDDCRPIRCALSIPRSVGTYIVSCFFFHSFDSLRSDVLAVHLQHPHWWLFAACASVCGPRMYYARSPFVQSGRICISVRKQGLDNMCRGNDMGCSGSISISMQQVSRMRISDMDSRPVSLQRL